MDTTTAARSVEGGRKGADDIELAIRLGHAIRAAMGSHIRQPELARATGIDQPTISKLIRGTRKSPLTVWEMMRFESATGRPHGWILQTAGIIESPGDVVGAVKGCPQLSPEGQRVILATIASFLVGVDESVAAAHARSTAHLLRSLLKPHKSKATPRR